MRKHRTMPRSRRSPLCGICNRPVDLASGYAFDPRPGVWVHPHCQAYELEYGPVPTGARPIQTCESPTCCNPAHLVLLPAVVGEA